MQEFQYTATDQQGQLQSGRLSAENLAAAERILTHDRGWNIVQILPVTLSPETGKLSRSASEQLATVLADLTSSQLPLETGLRMLGQELDEQSLFRGKKSRRELDQLAQLLEQGHTLDEALQHQGAPADLIAAIRAGIRSGNIGRALTQYVTYLKSLSTLRGRIAIGFGYPLLLILMSFLLLGALLGYIVPQFSNIYTGFGIEIPFITRSLINTSHFIMNHGWSIAITTGSLLIGIPLVLRFLPAYFRRRILLAIPFLGPVVEAVAMSRFTHALAFLTENGVPLPESLRLAGEGAEDEVISKTASEWAKCLEAGESLSEVSVRLRGIPAELFQMFSWQQDQQFFSRALHALGEMYEGRARIQSATLIALAEPTVVIVTGFIFFWVITGLFYPLVRLMNDLS